VTPAALLDRVGTWIASRPTHTKVLFCVASIVFLTELALRRLAPRSRAYRRWKHFFEAVGDVWGAVWLSLIYLLSVGPISLAMRARGKDLLDRKLTPAPSAWCPHEANPLGPRAAARHQF